MSRCSRVGVWLLLFACLTLACTSEATPTQLLVVVDSDLSLDANSPDALRTIQVTVLRADSGQEVVSAHPLSVSAAPKGPAEFELPLSFALTPLGVAEGTLFRVVVSGQNRSGEDIAERQVITAFRSGAALRLDLFLAASCLRELCRSDDQRTDRTCDVYTGACGQVPELTDLPVAKGSEVGGYVRPEARGDAGDSAPVKCQSRSECDDGLYCNGVEECDPGSVKANALGCVAGMVPTCAALETCDEEGDRCTSCTLVPDGDRDGVNAKACGGDDCNDGDPAIAPNHAEICDSKDNDCDEMTDVTPGGASVCSVAIDGGVDAAVVDAGGVDAGSDAGVVRMDGGGDAGSIDAGRNDAGPVDAAVEASAPDANVPLVSGCTMGSTMACSSFINVMGVEVPMGSYGSVMEPNVGQGFEAPVDTNDSTSGCASFAGIFGEPQATVDKMLALGSLDLRLHTLYRPARWVSGEKYPLIVWGNGTCMQPEIYGGHLRSLASQGFIVVAPNSRYVGSNDAMRLALDFAFAANSDTQSPYRGRIDTTKVGAMGHSQGGPVTVTLAGDARVQSVILFNGGTTASKPFLTIAADDDIIFTAPALADMQSAINAAPKAAYIFYHMVPMTPGASFSGHLTLLKQTNRVTGPTNAWWKYLLNNDETARAWFVGSSCMLCGHAADYEFGQNGL